jgi:hypothetical protein
MLRRLFIVLQRRPHTARACPPNPAEKSRRGRGGEMTSTANPDLPDQTMLHRVDIAIFDMAGIVGLVTDQMLPEAPLPDATFVSSQANGIEPLALRQRPREAALDQPPATREISIPRRQGPNRNTTNASIAKGSRFRVAATASRNAAMRSTSSVCRRSRRLTVKNQQPPE